MAKNRRHAALCAVCEMNPESAVIGGCLLDNSRIAVVGWQAEAGDAEQHRPFTSSMGKVFRAMITRAGYNPKTVWWTNVIQCPPSTGLDSASCLRRFGQELEQMAKTGIRVILASGQLVADWFGIKGKLLKIRGSVYESHGFYIIPTFEPAFFMAGNQHHEPTWCADIEKAFRLAADGWKPPVEHFDINLSIDKLETIFHELSKDTVLGCDLETTSLDPFQAKIIVFGVAFNNENAVSIPFMKQGGLPCWNTPEQQQRARKIVQHILDTFETLWQNGAYDLSVLLANGYAWPKRLPHDIMLMHHAFHPELPHDLGYISSIYADTPYWKGAVLGAESSMVNLPDEQLRTYNLRDCVVLHQIRPGLLADMKNAGTYHIYESISRKLIRPTVMMQMHGMKLYANRLPGWIAEVEAEVEKQKKAFVAGTKVPENFNPASAFHCRKLFFGFDPPGFEKKIAELAGYELLPEKKRQTKKYAALVDAVAVIQNISPLLQLPGGFTHTAGGQADLSSTILNKMRMKALDEINLIGKFRHPTKNHELKIAGYERLVRVIGCFLEYKKWAKLQSTYTKFRTGSDGHIHPSYSIHGTRTGRLASRGPNWQNLPATVKKLFGPVAGNVFVQADYSNIDMRVLSYESGDDVLQAIFASGARIHDENVKILFGLFPDDPMFPVAKRAAKTYIFGRGYGGRLKGIYERIVSQISPMEREMNISLGLTWEKFCTADAAYRQAHPAYVAWVGRMLEQGEITRACTTEFGRKRFFLGTNSEISREILNTPIQGTAADVCNTALISMQEWIDGHPEFKTRLVGTVHDSIVIECPEIHAVKMAGILKSIMEKPLELWTRRVVFPAEIEICTKSWAEHVSLEEFTNGNSRNQRCAGDTAPETDWNFEGEETEIAEN